MGGRRGRIDQIAEEFRAAVQRREQQALQRLVQVYEQAWQRAGTEVAQLARLGADPLAHPFMAYEREERLYALAQQLRDEIEALLQTAGEVTTDGQQTMAELAQVHAERWVRATSAELRIVWNHLPTETVETLLGRLQPGSPLADLLQRVGTEALRQVTREMTTGIALGLNPREVAERMVTGLRMTYGRAERIARTEMLRTYREVTRQSYLANREVVTGWMWYSALDVRTCPACWAMHGTVHTLDETLDDHPNGRCVMVPVTRMLSEEERRALVLTGEERFARLPAERQRVILGARAYEAYRAGQVRLADFVGQRYDPRWGAMRYALSWRTVSRTLGLGG